MGEEQPLERLHSRLQKSPKGESAASGQNYIRSSGSIRLLTKTTAPALCLCRVYFPWEMFAVSGQGARISSRVGAGWGQGTPG